MYTGLTSGIQTGRRRKKISTMSRTSWNSQTRKIWSRTSYQLYEYFISVWLKHSLTLYRYKIGDSFISLPLPEVQEMLSASSSQIEEEESAVAEKLSSVREEMSQLKVELYARFGRSINLET
jgi:hypothetical protein